jgi:hypothetical protein
MSKSSIAKKVRAFKFGQLVMTELGINYATHSALELKAMTERELVIELQNMNGYLYEQDSLFIELFLLKEITLAEQKETHIKLVSVIEFISFCLKAH